MLGVEAFLVTAGARWSEGWWRVVPSTDVEQSRCCAFRRHLLTPSQTEFDSECVGCENCTVISPKWGQGLPGSSLEGCPLLD